MVDVVILTWNDGELLQQAVDSALASAGVEVHVTVVDNGSSPAAEVPDDDRVTLIVNDANRGVAPARNQGACAGDSPYVCFLDSDARLLPGTLWELAAPLAEDAAVAMSAPVFTGQPPVASAGAAPTLRRKVARGLNLTSTYRATPQDGPWWDVDFAIGACQLIRRSAFQSVAGLDGSYFYGPEDVDFCLRLKEAGWRVVQVGSAACHHPARRRFRGIWTRRGMGHAWALARHLWRHSALGRRPRWSH